MHSFLSKKTARLFLGIQHHFGLLLLCVLLSVISFFNFSQTDLLGWDNFSINLDPSLNLYRAAMSSWREYRGLGAPNDSEQVDFFRAVIYVFLSFFLSSEIINNIYACILLVIGCIGMFYLAVQIAKESNIQFFKSRFYLQIIGFLSASFYLFSLHTVGTFYLPIAMYVARYAFFPCTLLFFLKLSRGECSRKNVLAFIVSTLFLSTSYLTATVFITFFMILMTVLFSRLHYLKQYALSLLLFLGLNAFWLIGFINYSIQKSSLLPLASTFIEVNQIQLNQAEENFTWFNVLTFTPSFFTTTYQPLDQEPSFLLPLVDQIHQELPLKIILFLPAVFAVLGFGCMFFFFVKKRSSSLIWIPILSLAALFFLRREYPPIGFLYDFLSTYIPLLKIVFRFSSEKFSQLLVMCFALSASFFIVVLLRFFERHTGILKRSFTKTIQFTFVATLCVMLSYPFLSFWISGGFFSPMVRTHIPDQYQEVARLVDQESTGRLLHLPFDEYSYWKSYQWGYVGSSFLHFMLHQPLIDRTFEPASMENDEFHLQILDIVRNSSQLKQEDLADKADMLIGLLRQTGTSYVLLDESVSQQVLSRQSQYWGEFNLADSAALIAYLEQKRELLNIYDQEIMISGNQSGRNPHLKLYKVEKPVGLFHSITTALKVDQNLKTDFIPDLFMGAQDYIQDSTGKEFRSYPFLKSDSVIETNPVGVSIQQHLPSDKEPISRTGFNEENSSQIAVSVFTEPTSSGLEVRLKVLTTPLDFKTVIEKSEFDQRVLLEDSNILSSSTQSTKEFVSNWSVINGDIFKEYRLKVGESTLPILSQPGYLGTVLVDSNSTQVSLLKKSETLEVEPEKLQMTTEFNCFNDATADYVSDLEYFSNQVVLHTKDGTSCLTFPVAQPAKENVDHLELIVNAQSNILKNPLAATKMSEQSWQRIFSQAIDQYMKGLPERMNFGFCFLDQTGRCLNTVQGTELTRQPMRLTLPLERSSETVGDTQMLLTFPSFGHENIEYTLGNIQTDIFTQVDQSASLKLDVSNTGTKPDNSNGIILPYTFSDSSFLFQAGNKSILEGYNGACEEENGYRSVRKLDAQRTVGYVSDCQQGFFFHAPFTPNQFYWWDTTYNVYSGKDPKFSIQGEGSYKDEYLSRYQVFPNIPYFQSLRKADGLLQWSTSSYQAALESLFSQAKYHHTYTTVQSDDVPQEERNILPFQVTQHSQNQGVLEVASMNLMKLPKDWQNFFVDYGQPTQEFSPIKFVSFEKFTPAIWKVQLEFNQTSNGQQKPALLQFGQAYDAQWQLYPPQGTHQVKLNGWSNGWMIDPSVQRLGAVQTFYIIYYPELMNFIGWGLTYYSGVLGIFFLAKKFVPQRTRHRRSSHIRVHKKK